jgi:hypothetical protein
MGTNSTQPLDTLEQGFGLFNDFQQRINSRSKGDNSVQARLWETEAKGNVHDIRRKAVKDGQALREDREKNRSSHNTKWGGSNLAMSGSKKLIRDAERIQDRQDEEDVLFQGEMDARGALNDARRRSNLLRINSGLPADRSTLSLGSKIYGTRS